MANRNKFLNGEICEGCLSSDRKLLPINQYLRIYQKLMEDFLSELSSQDQVISQIPRMCWECLNFLRNAQKFQKKTKQAHEFLMAGSVNKMSSTMHLSTLTIFLKNAPDYEISFDKTQKLRREDNHTFLKRNEEAKIYSPEHNEEIKFEIIPEVIKDEAEDSEDVKLEDNCGDLEDLLEDAGQIENDEENYSLLVSDQIKELIETNDEIQRKKKTIEKRKSSMHAKFKVVNVDKTKDQDYGNLFLKVEIAEGDRERYLERARNRDKFMNARYKCDICVNGFHNERNYDKHMKRCHLESNKFVCDVCGIRTESKTKLAMHIKRHKYKYVCKLCGYECLKCQEISYHMVYTHQRLVECRKCGIQFQYKEFYKHYNSKHRWFICDDCGYKTIQKQLLINHIRIRHGENVCKYCGRRYAHYHSMTRHIALRHTRGNTEESYCVECNIQFDNLFQYNEHLKKSVKHKPKIGFPCPECNKVYAKQTCMKNHYKYIHLQKTSYYCEECSRYFLNGFRLRTHIASYHKKIQPPRNKMCSYCGRGFRTNRILDNHVRTHTGERPFSCAHCPATFAQQSALVTHTRAIHKIMMRYAQAD